MTEISATEADWSREQLTLWWNASRQLLKALRQYQKWQSKNGFLFKIMMRWSVIQHRFWSVVAGADIPLNCQIAGGLLMPHPTGIVIHPSATIGPNCLILQQVTIVGGVQIGGHVDIGAGAKIIRPVKIGNHAKIGANAVVLSDVPDGTTAVGIPAKIITKSSESLILPISRMEAVQTPIIPVVGQLISENVGTISLGQGVVSYSPPAESVEFLSAFLADPENHKYKAVQGIQPLLSAISVKLKEDNNIHLNQQQKIVVTAGSNMAFINALLAITSPGDEIILNTPYYFNHEMASIMADCHPVLVKTDQNYQLRPDAIAAAITEKTKAVVTISPNNPTGVVYAESLLREVNQLCQSRGIYHISDEAYEYFTYEGIEHFSPGSIIGSEDYTISLYSLSKAYGFASWRIGYMIIPEHLFVGINKIQDTILICPPVISQYAALGAFKAGKVYCQEHLEKIATVRKIVLESLDSLEDLCTIAPAKGAFYFFVRVNRDIDDFQLLKMLIEQYKIAVLPGSTFGMKDGCYLRLAYGALQPETAAEGMGRFVKGLQEILR